MLCRKYTGVEEITPNLTSQGKPCRSGIYVKILQTGHVQEYGRTTTSKKPGVKFMQLFLFWKTRLLSCLHSNEYLLLLTS